MKLRQLFLLQKIKTTITVLLIGLQAITQTLAALILALAINDLIAKELQSFFIQIGWVILMWVITLSSSYCAAFLKQKIIQDSAEYLREQALTKAYQTTEQSEGEVKKAYYINLATTDILTIETGISSVFVLIGSIMAAISSSIALFYYSYWLVLATFFFSLLFLVIPIVYKKQLIEVTQNVSKQNKLITKDTTNLIMGIFDLFNEKIKSIP